MAIHHLNPVREHLHGTFCSTFEPVLHINSGDTVIVSTLDARWTVTPPPDQLSPGEMMPGRRDGLDGGHALNGPIFVHGAEPGDTLEIRIGSIVPGSYGWNFGGGWKNRINERLGIDEGEVRLGWSLENGIGTDQFGRKVHLAPFFGVMGMPDSSGDVLPTAPPRRTGGNLDCKELVSGTTLLLPIDVAGGLFSVGDGHARQGDGEVSTTAIECPIEQGELTLIVRKDMPISHPVARTADSWLTFGMHEDLDEAVLMALGGMLDLMQRELGCSRHEAMALASVVVDVRVTQIVNGVRGAHAVLQDGAIFR